MDYFTSISQNPLSKKINRKDIKQSVNHSLQMKNIFYDYLYNHANEKLFTPEDPLSDAKYNYNSIQANIARVRSKAIIEDKLAKTYNYQQFMPIVFNPEKYAEQTKYLARQFKAEHMKLTTPKKLIHESKNDFNFRLRRHPDNLTDRLERAFYEKPEIHQTTIKYSQNELKIINDMRELLNNHRII